MKTMKTQQKVNEPLPATVLLGLVADIRAAVGDPTGRLMQDELVARCRQMREVLIFVRDECEWETPRGDERIGPAITLALNWPNGDEAATQQSGAGSQNDKHSDPAGENQSKP